jgi:hypothetical protein
MAAPIKRPVKVIWNFAPKPPEHRMRTFKNGQSVRAEVGHCPFAEGAPIEQVYCYGCERYFDSYHHYLWQHGQCKEPPPKKKGRK